MIDRNNYLIRLSSDTLIVFLNYLVVSEIDCCCEKGDKRGAIVINLEIIVSREPLSIDNSDWVLGKIFSFSIMKINKSQGEGK